MSCVFHRYPKRLPVLLRVCTRQFHRALPATFTFIGFIVLFPFAGISQTEAGAISRSQCVVSGGTPVNLTSIRPAVDMGLGFYWELSDNASFTGPGYQTLLQTNSQTFVMGPHTTDLYYRRVVPTGLPAPVAYYSNVVKVSIVAATNSPTFIPTAASTICQGDISFDVSYFTLNSATKYSIIWDATAVPFGFVDVLEQNLPASSPLPVTVSATAPSGTYTGTLIPYDVNGCSISGTVASFTFNPRPTVVVSAPSAVCRPNSVDLTVPAISTGSSSGLSYTQWNDAATTSAVTNPTAVTNPGIYYIKGAIPSTGCAVVRPVTVTINPLPVSSITPGGAVSFCSGTSVTLTGNGGAAYQWSTGETTPVIIVSNGGTYSVTAISSSGCTAVSPQKTITVIPLPTATIAAGGPLSFCAGGSVTLSGVAGNTYQWSSGQTTQQVSVNSTGSYSLVVTNASGCTATSSSTIVTVFQPVTPTITAGSSTSFCAGGSVTLSSNNASAYHWNAGQTTQSITVSSPGTYSLTTIDTNGCATGTSLSTTVTVNPLPVAAVTALSPTTFCAGGATTLIASPGASYQWSTGETTQSISVHDPGDYLVSITSGAGCTTISSPTTITVIAMPTTSITAGGPLTFCAGGSVTLTANAGSSYLWSTGQTTQTIAVSNAGNYSVTITNAPACSATSLPVQVSVNPLPSGVLQTPPVTYICNGSGLTLQASGASTYQWYMNQQVIAGATASAYTATAAGTYGVSFTSQQGCMQSSSATVQLSVITKATPAFSLNAQCISTTITFANSSAYASSGPITWTWDFGDGGTSTAFSPVHVYATEGTYTIGLTANNVSCPSLTEKTTAVYTIEKPETAVRYPLINAVGGSQVTLTARAFGKTYTWKPVTGLNDPSIQAPLLTASVTTDYTVDILSTAGCVTTDSVLVKVTNDGAIYVPTGFTPNGDGVNDRAYPITIGIKKLIYFKIYNRWGNLLFQTNDLTPANGWDGKYQGKLQPPGTYTWIAEGLDGHDITIRSTGNIILLN